MTGSSTKQNRHLELGLLRVLAQITESAQFLIKVGMNWRNLEIHCTHMGQIVTIRVVAAVIQRKATYLVCQRPLCKRHGNLWEFPGGKCEPGESDAAALHRELREELGVSITSVGAELFAVEDPESPFVIAFIPVTINGEPSCLEHSALTWAPIAILLYMPLAPSDRRFLEHLQA